MAAGIIYFLKVMIFIMPWCLGKLGLKVTHLIEKGGNQVYPKILYCYYCTTLFAFVLVLYLKVSIQLHNSTKELMMPHAVSTDVIKSDLFVKHV